MNLTDMKTYCIVDQKEIPQDRAIRKSNTCSKDCATALKKFRRACVDLRRCRHCHRPSTPEERVAFTAWRRSQPGYLGKKGRPRNKPAETEPQPAEAQS